MSIELVTKFQPYTDELFKAESKISLLTNTDFDFTGAHSVKIWKISTADLNDYTRNVSSTDEVTSISRFGDITDLSAQTEEFLLSNDRSFIFNIDYLDEDQTAGQISAASALAREIREVVIPEVDAYTYGVMVDGAGTTVTGTLTADNVYDAICTGSALMDDAEVPDTDRAIVVTPAVYKLLKTADVFDQTDAAAEMRKLGVIGQIDGCNVIKVPSSRLPDNFDFMIIHPSATCAPVRLEDYGTHNNTPLSSGTIVTGRICYDAFVLDNKKDGIYVFLEESEEEETE